MTALIASLAPFRITLTVLPIVRPPRWSSRALNESHCSPAASTIRIGWPARTFSPTSAEVGENVRAGQPILMVEAAGEQWLSFNAREDHLGGLTMGRTVSVMRNGASDAIKAVITELRPLGTFATWQAERVIGDHDRSTLRLRLDPKGEPVGLEPGMTVW